MALFLKSADSSYATGTAPYGGGVVGSFAAWVYPRSAANGVIIEVKDPAGGSGVNQIGIWFMSTETARIRISNGSSSDYAQSGTASVPLNRWTHIVGVSRTTTSKTIYANGVGTEVTTSQAGPSATPTQLNIGWQGGSSPGIYFDGFIAYPAYWDVALTASDVAALIGGSYPPDIKPAGLMGYFHLSDSSPSLQCTEGKAQGMQMQRGGTAIITPDSVYMSRGDNNERLEYAAATAATAAGQPSRKRFGGIKFTGNQSQGMNRW